MLPEAPTARDKDVGETVIAAVIVTGTLTVVLLSLTDTAVLPAAMPVTRSVTPLLVTLEMDTVATALLFDLAWISPLALLTSTEAWVPTGRVTLVGDTASAEASPENAPRHMTSHASKRPLLRRCPGPAG
jgi:hypothetical protein